jgi:hypothetical protein
MGCRRRGSDFPFRLRNGYDGNVGVAGAHGLGWAHLDSRPSAVRRPQWCRDLAASAKRDGLLLELPVILIMVLIVMSFTTPGRVQYLPLVKVRNECLRAV